MIEGELALLVNNNFKKPLNEQIMDYNLLPMHLFTSNAAFTPSKTGLYRIICIGAGGNGGHASFSGGVNGGGGAGGVVVAIRKLSSLTSYAITVSQNASFAFADDVENTITAMPGGNGTRTSYGSEEGQGGNGAGTNCHIYPGNNGSSGNGGNIGIYSIGMIGYGGNGTSGNPNGYGGGGGGFGAGGGGRNYTSGSGSVTGGSGGSGFAGGRGYTYNKEDAQLGGGSASNTYAGAGGSAAVIVEFISEE